MSSKFTPLLLLAVAGCAALPSHNRLDRDLVLAAFHGNPAEVERLLELGARVDGRCGPVPEATFRGRDGGVPVAGAAWTALIAAASAEGAPDVADGHLRVVRLLLARGAERDLDDGYGATALYSAVCRAGWAPDGEPPMVLELLRAGANVNTRTEPYLDGPGNETPLHRATGSPALVGLLLRHGARADAVTTDGETVLHWAVRDRDVDSVRLLLAAGAKPDVADRQGDTPLAWASAARRRERLTASVLQDPSLSPEGKADVLGLLETQAAAGRRDGEIEALLRAAGAKAELR